jgi:hypothetical protein
MSELLLKADISGRAFAPGQFVACHHPPIAG